MRDSGDQYLQGLIADTTRYVRIPETSSDFAKTFGQDNWTAIDLGEVQLRQWL